jgi:hypothetical protein
VYRTVLPTTGTTCSTSNFVWMGAGSLGRLGSKVSFGHQDPSYDTIRSPPGGARPGPLICTTVGPTVRTVGSHIFQDD